MEPKNVEFVEAENGIEIAKNEEWRCSQMVGKWYTIIKLIVLR